ncbi:MAG: AAA family ATPase [Candidatus Micrarchaeales archaeon]|nr:AAA family ATPase [Candidatus Micrarchaeales archaeon]
MTDEQFKDPGAGRDSSRDWHGTSPLPALSKQVPDQQNGQPHTPHSLIRPTVMITQEQAHHLQTLMNPKTLMSLPQRYLTEITSGLVGRKEEALVAALAVFTKEHVLFVGEPGTAKSFIAVRAAKLMGGKCFEDLLTRYTEPEDELGPRNVNAYKEGKWKRVMDGYLPKAQTAVFDEFFNAGHFLTVLNGILNERKFRDGPGVIEVELITAFASTNALPEPDERLDAVRDRFLFKRLVKPIGEDKIDDLITAGDLIERTKAFKGVAEVMYDDAVLSNEQEIENGEPKLRENDCDGELKDRAIKQFVIDNRGIISKILQYEGWSEEMAGETIEAYINSSIAPVMTAEQLKLITGVIIPEIEAHISPEVRTKMEMLLLEMKKEGLSVSDRNEPKILKVLAARALLDGRFEIKERDLMVLKYLVPKEMEDFAKVEKLLISKIPGPDAYLEKLDEWARSISEAERALTSVSVDEDAKRQERWLKVLTDMQTTKVKINQLEAQTDEQSVIERAGQVNAQIDKFVMSLAKRLNIQV